jgi:hypothetical protein
MGRRDNKLIEMESSWRLRKFRPSAEGPTQPRCAPGPSQKSVPVLQSITLFTSRSPRIRFYVAMEKLRLLWRSTPGVRPSLPSSQRNVRLGGGLAGIFYGRGAAVLYCQALLSLSSASQIRARWTRDSIFLSPAFSLCT